MGTASNIRGNRSERKENPLLAFPGDTQENPFAGQVSAARAFFETGATRALEYREERLRALARAVDTHEKALLAALRADLGKPATEAYVSEIAFVQADIAHALRHLRRWARPRRARVPWIAWPARAEVRPEPLGVALVLGPWNYPFQLLFSPLVGALAAGNCAVLKPSELAPRTSAATAELVRAHFPPEYLSVAEGGRETAEALLRERFDHVFFTGGGEAGRAVMAAAARHLTPVTLELGGKSPCIVCADADPELAARRILWGKTLNAGQTCVAPDFVLADARIKDALLDALGRTLRRFFGDNPAASPDYGRIVNRRHFDRLTAYLGQGRIVHGGRHDAETLYIEPTILADPAPDAPVMREEIFGPVLPVLGFDALDAALARLRGMPRPLALYLFTNDAAVRERVLRETVSGGVCVNDTLSHIVGRDMPFGGVGESGMGAYHGKTGFDCFTHHRTVMRRGVFPDPALRYPPVRWGVESMRRAFRLIAGG